jgi:SAM-dependent methyltransferase
MDARDADPAALRRALRVIRRINALLGYSAATVRAMDALVGKGKAALSVLDIATGSADFPADLLRQARRRGWAMKCTGLDLQPATLAVAREWAPEVPLVRGDALRLPFADGSFDVATCCMFLHHLETPDAVQVLREMDRITRRGWIAADLLRRRRALAWITLFTLFAGPMVRHDARTSVRQAWTPAEAHDLPRQAGLPAVYAETFGHRFLLVRRKGPED